MKVIIAACVLAMVATAFARPNKEEYTDKYDNVNIDEIIANKRLMDPYVKCLLDQGKCAPDAKELKAHIREALENHCGKCTKAQENGTRKVIGHLINNESEYWKQLSGKYDSEGKFTKKYEDELKTIKA